MNHPAEEAASHAARNVEWGTWLRSVGGAGTTVGIKASQVGSVSDWVALAVGILTAAYTLLKIFEWFEARADRAAARAARDAQTRSLEHLHELWEQRAMARSRPAELDDPQDHHKGK